ncbi:phasin family protein [Methylobacterium sp. CM6257]
MQQVLALTLLPGSAGFGTALRRFGVASRTAQTVGIEWFDYAKQGLDDIADTARKLAEARSPAEILAVQAAYLQRAGERFTVGSAVVGDLIMTLAGDLLRPPAATSSARTH